jgi:hypothetical protein
MSADTPVIDLGYRPQSHFWPITHDTHVIAAIKGERRRNAIRHAFDADRMSPLDGLYATPIPPDEHRLALGSLRPSFTGGEHLPDRRDTVVEIALINIDSTTSNATSVYARPGKDRVDYRVVDEYWGDSLTEKRTRSSRRPSSEFYPQFAAAIRARIDGWYAEGECIVGGVQAVKPFRHSKPRGTSPRRQLSHCWASPRQSGSRA